MNVSIPKGTRDFSPQEMVKRNYIFDTIRGVFKLYGYKPIETPAMENLSTLMGKYGEEGDKLLFKILNSGNYLQNTPSDLLNTEKHIQLTTAICEKGLRYDLTVPFARYVVQHRNEIVFPFKRYQIQPVWRADRPQKGRYREFYQCDADVIGSDSLINELELILIINDVFSRLGLNVVIKLNNRKILSGIAEIMGQADKLVNITTAIDKIDKIGIDCVIKELKESGIADEQINMLRPVLELNGTNDQKTDTLEQLFQTSEIGLNGVKEMREIFSLLKQFKNNNIVEADLSLARGLNYYTGTIIEVKAVDAEMGSICGGGRYDNLTGIFGLKNMSGVGISFGADRIYDVLSTLNLFPNKAEETTHIMFTNMGEHERNYCLAALQLIREAGISAEIYPDCSKVKKQMEYADKMNIPFVAIAGENEISKGVFMLKNMKTKEQFEVPKSDLINRIKP